MGSTANRQGRVIADDIAGLGGSFGGVLGTGIVKIFDLTAGQTLSLSAGEHTLQMTCVSGLLNLDYLLLAPQ